MSRLCLLLNLALVLLSTTEAYHVLLVFPLPSKSHFILAEGFASSLLDAGHEVTLIAPFPYKTNNTKYHEVLVSSNAEAMDGKKNTNKVQCIMIIPQYHRDHGAYNSAEISRTQKSVKKHVNADLSIGKIMRKEISIEPTAMLAMLTKAYVATSVHPDVVKLLNSDVKFDVAIIEWLFSEHSIGYAAVFGCPYIYFGTTDPHGMTLRLIDENTSPTVLAPFTSSNVPPLSFYNRVHELGAQLFIDLYKEFIMYKADKQFYEETFGPYVEKKGRKLPPFDEYRHNASLMFGNSHVSLGTAHRLPQSYKPIGGYHIKAHTSTLPTNLKKIMDNAKDGVIYFSMGSNLNSRDLPQSLKQELLNLFGSLKYTILWKFEEELPNLPKNVHILKWAPQPAILGHKNCILFITHGGLLSTTEAIHYGVPTIGIPVFGDQPTNVRKAVNKGYALLVELSFTMVEELKDAINEITSNPKYTKTAKRLSLIYHDRPVPPAKELVHWIEHVVKTDGAAHLRSPALMVTWYQKLYLDALALLIIVIVVLVKVVKKVYSSMFSKSKIRKNKKNN